MKRYFGILTSLFIFFTLIGFISFFANIDMSTLEDFIWLKPAVDMAHGQVLFKDIFTIYGMFTAFLYGVTVKWFGSYLILLRFETVIAYGPTGVLLFQNWTQFMSKKLASISLLLWLILAPFYTHMLLPWNSVYALVFQNITFLSLLLFLKKQNNYLLLLSGMGVGLTFFTRQPVGVFLLGATCSFFLLMFFLKKYFFRKLLLIYAYLLIGICLSSLPFFIYLIKHNVMYDWWVQSFVYARELAAVVRGVSIDQVVKSLTMARYLKNGTYLLNIIWILIPISSFWFIFKPVKEYIKDKKLSDKNVRLILAALICLASWMQYYPATDPIHFFWAVSPTMGFFLYTLIDIFIPKKTAVLNIVIYLLGIEMILFLSIRLISVVPRLQATNTYSQNISSLRNIKLTSYDRNKIDSFYTKLVSRLTPNDTYVNISDDAMVPMLDKRFHFIPPLYMEWGFATDKFYKNHSLQTLSYIASSKPVIVSRTLPFIPNYCFVKDVVYQQEEMNIHVPLDRIMSTKIIDDTIQIDFKKEMKINSVKALLNPINGFSVPDKKLLKFKTLESDMFYQTLTTALPNELKKPYWIIVQFDDDDIDTCTIAVK